MYFLVGGNSSLLARGRERGKSWKSRSLHTHTQNDEQWKMKLSILEQQDVPKSYNAMMKLLAREL